MAQPAIVLITCDQLNRGVLGCYHGQTITTPNIDRLAEEGTQYTNCHTVSPWCLPARCSILTGLYPHQNRAYSNFRKCSLDRDLDNLFFSLKEAGYRTSLFGKCHFAPVPYSEAREDKTLPYDEFHSYYQSLGIDDLKLQDDKQVSVWFYDDYSKALDEAGYLEAYRKAVWDPDCHKVFPFPGPAMWHPDAWVGTQAAGYIKNYSRKEPLFSWISFSGPHFAFDAPKEYVDKVDRLRLPERVRWAGEFDDTSRIHYDSYHGGESNNIIEGARQADGHACKNYTEAYWEEMRTSYYASVKMIDDQVGNIINAVREKYGNNALILFTADHGEMLGDHDLWGKNLCAYDEVWKIPLIVRYPGENCHTVDRRLTNSTDILPTCLKTAGVQMDKCDGHNLNDQSWNRDYTFAEGEGFLAVTDGICKYIHLQRGDHQARELLDLKEDPHEFENRINQPQYQERLAVLREKMIEHIIPAVLA